MANFQHIVVVTLYLPVTTCSISSQWNQITFLTSYLLVQLHMNI